MVELCFGRHRVWQEDDVAVARIAGAFDRADAVAFHDFLDRVYAERGRCFALADVSAMTGLDAGARRYTAEWNKQRKLAAVAVFGASVTIRGLASMLVTAIRLVNRRQTVPVEFFKDEAEARRWISARRAEAPA